MPGCEAGLADQRRLLVAGDAGDRPGRAEQSFVVLAPKSSALSRTSGSSCRGILNSRSSSSSQSCVWMLNSMVRRGVGDVGRVHLAAGQPPQQEAVDGAERQLAALGRRPRARHVVQQPGASWWRRNTDRSAGRSCACTSGSHGRSSISVRHSAAVRRSCQTMARGSASPVLRFQMTVVSRWLVMPMAATSAGLTRAFSTTPRTTATVSLPDLFGVMLDPASLRDRSAAVPPGRSPAGSPVAVEQDRPAAGRALVDRQDVCRRHDPPGVLWMCFVVFGIDDRKRGEPLSTAPECCDVKISTKTPIPDETGRDTGGSIPP